MEAGREVGVGGGERWDARKVRISPHLWTDAWMDGSIDRKRLRDPNRKREGRKSEYRNYTA